MLARHAVANVDDRGEILCRRRRPAGGHIGDIGSLRQNPSDYKASQKDTADEAARAMHWLVLLFLFCGTAYSVALSAATLPHIELFVVELHLLRLLSSDYIILICRYRYRA